MKRKMISISLACFALLSLNVMPVKAQEWEQSFSVSSGFNSAWSRSYTYEFKLEEGVYHYVALDYGYDTWAVKEDYVKNVHGTPQGYSAKGKVTNSEGTTAETGYVQSGFSSGKADVKHTGTATYTGVLKKN